MAVDGAPYVMRSPHRPSPPTIRSWPSWSGHTPIEIARRHVGLVRFDFVRVCEALAVCFNKLCDDRRCFCDCTGTLRACVEYILHMAAVLVVRVETEAILAAAGVLFNLFAEPVILAAGAFCSIVA